jgi:iron(II)-dependent oxidoreductase
MPTPKPSPLKAAPPEVWLRRPQVAAALEDARRRTLELVEDLTDEQLRVPLLPIINPILWEIGHVAWFQEKWALRHLRGEPPVLAHGDALYDSAAVAHDTRWDLALPSRAETLAYMREVLDRVLDRLPPGDLSENEAYFHWLPVMHEDMHDEAFTYTRQTLGYAAPKFSNALALVCAGESVSGDVEIPGGEFLLGAPRGEVFVFDNEKWAHPVRVEPFRIARMPVTNGEFAEFVDDGGYRRRELWSADGWAWREKARAEHPVYWSCDAAGWLQRHFDQVHPLSKTLSGAEGPRAHPIIHVNWFEAEAWCRWAKRRLPTEAEWELAAATTEKSHYPWGEELPSPERANLDGRALGCVPVSAHAEGDTASGCRQMLGNVWEWTASVFAPYPGFVIDPYKEYSAPWFTGDYRVLRGGCWATRSRLIRNTWRNFYTRDRRDVFAGFRTCTL